MSKKYSKEMKMHITCSSTQLPGDYYYWIDYNGLSANQQNTAS